MCYTKMIEKLCWEFQASVATYQAKNKKVLVSGNPTDPYILGPTQAFLKAFWDI